MISVRLEELIELPWIPKTDSPLKSLPDRPAYNYYVSEHANQLRMVRQSVNPVEVPPIPKDYKLRQFHRGDDKSYQELFDLAFHMPGALAKTLEKVLTDGFFVIEHMPSATIVASCVAERESISSNNSILGWLVCDPSHTGKRLGTIVAAAVTNKLVKEGCVSPCLSTDDFRLAAIRIYFDLGWRPYLYNPDMKQRWDKTCMRLGRDVDSKNYVIP